MVFRQHHPDDYGYGLTKQKNYPTVTEDFSSITQKSKKINCKTLGTVTTKLSFQVLNTQANK